MTIRLLLCGIISLATAISQEDITSIETVVTRETARPDIDRRAGDYQLYIYYVSKGTKSEGIIGRLRKGDKEIIGTDIGEKIKTPFGIYIWHGAIKDRKQLWDISGWLPEEISTVYPSWAKKGE